MSKRVSEEARVMDFFETADKVKVETVFNLVKGTMARRFPKAVSATPKPRKARKLKNTELSPEKSSASVPATNAA